MKKEELSRENDSASVVEQTHAEIDTTSVNGEATENKNEKKRNIFVRLWKYFTTYEKIWLFVFCTTGIVLGLLFPEEQGWVNAFAIITLVGGCTCELLLSKQSKWAFIISFFFYDLTQIVVYFANGYYVSALFEIIFWCPMLFLSFFTWDKKQDKDDATLTEVKGINYKKELAMFLGVLFVSVGVGLLFTFAGTWFPNSWFSEGLSKYWYIDALANTFSVCNGLFLWFRYKEQWIAWLGVAFCETIMWSISHQWTMLILQAGYLTNTIYGFIMWTKYIKQHKNIDETAQESQTTETQETIVDAGEKSEIENNK